jgi:hypothetical protein
MGLVSKIGEMRMKDPVEGTLTVASITMPSPTATSMNYRIDGAVAAPGVPATAIVHRGVALVNKWPRPGDVLPVTVDRAKPERLVIQWDRVSTGREQAQSSAQDLAEQIRASLGEAFASSPSDPSDSTTTTTTIEVTPTVSVGSSSPNMPSMSTVPTGSPPQVSSADILARGTAGLASIEAVFPSAEVSPKPEHTVVGLQLNVMIVGRAPFQITNLYAVPNAKLGAACVGMTVPVKADLATTGLVAVDWAAVTLS